MKRAGHARKIFSVIGKIVVLLVIPWKTIYDAATWNITPRIMDPKPNGEVFDYGDFLGKFIAFLLVFYWLVQMWMRYKAKADKANFGPGISGMLFLSTFSEIFLEVLDFDPIGMDTGVELTQLGLGTYVIGFLVILILSSTNVLKADDVRIDEMEREIEGLKQRISELQKT